MKTRSLRFFPVLCWLLAPVILSATVLRVPADYATIQAAVNVAQEGDTVLVSPGVYYENVQLTGRNIVLTGRFELDRNPALIEQTVIDGSQPVHADTASCLLIWKHNTAATVVQGFTFRNGAGTVWLDPAGYGTFREGGGILTEYSSPVIRHNIIRDNVIPSGGAGLVSTGGAGIRCGEGAPLLENNVIVHNRADGYGGGIVLNYCPGAVVRNNIIARNYAGKAFSGAGFWATGADHNTVVYVQNNVIAWNETPAATGQYGGKGGGIWVFSIKAVIKNNIVWGNSQAVGKQIGHQGAALEVQYNCVEDGFTGAGNITAFPQWADTTCFMLSAGSPCIDAGDPAAAVYDQSANGRIAQYPARGGLRNDIGVYGGPQGDLAGCFNPFGPAPVFTSVANSQVSTTAGDSRSVNWIDVDGDSDLDLFISNGPEQGENNFLYKNNGAGVFTLILNDPIVQDSEASDGATWADYDNDGDNDCFVVNWYNHNNMLFKNTGNGQFERILAGPPVTNQGYSETAAWADYDNDGLLDLYVTNSAGNLKNFLYRQSAGGVFTKITAGAPVTDAQVSRCVSWTDYDMDGRLDLFVTNENNQAENLYHNEGGGNFTKITAGPLLNNGGKTMSASWGDYNNDGLPDVFLANDQGNDGLFRNDGGGNFTKITAGPVGNSGGNSFGSEWADVDNNGYLDLLVTNAFWGGPWRNFLFMNNGDGTFRRDSAEVVSQDEGWSYGCAFGDMDHDGDLDLVVANCRDAAQPDYLYENHAAENTHHWLVVNCIGTISNRSAIGAKVWVHITLNGQPVTLLREISSQSGYCGQNQLSPHFGLGDAGQIESIVVQWPSGIEQVFGNIQPDQYVTITEGSGIVAAPTPAAISGFTLYPPAPNPFSDTTACRMNMARPARVTAVVYDLQGKMVRNLLQDELLEAGNHMLVWDGHTASGASAPAGMYVLSVNADGALTARAAIKR